MHKKSVGVLGAGVAGVSAAYYLAKAGYSVTVYDEKSYAGMDCSYANGGQLSVSNAQTWHQMSNVIKGIKWLGKKDAPLLVRPSLDVQKALWMARFLRYTLQGKSNAWSIQTIALGLEARALYAQIMQEEQLEFDYKKCGILHFYKDPSYWKGAQNVRNLYENAGCEWSLLSEQEVKEKEPALASVQGILGGAWTAEDGVGDIHKFCVHLLQRMQDRMDVRFYKNYQIDVKQISALLSAHGKVVIALGAATKGFADALGDECTIYPIKGYSVTLHENPVESLPKVSLLDDQAKIVSSTLGNRLRIAGTAELTGYNKDIRIDRIEPLLRWVQKNLPQVSTKDFSSYACLRPMSASMMPMSYKSAQWGVYYHAGHGHLGWTLAPATAKELVEVIQKDG